MCSVMKKLIKKFWKISTLKYLVAFLIPAIFVMFINQGLDNDSWFVLAEGRYLANNGIHYTDVLTMHEGLNIVVQNYGFATIFYLVHSAFGAPGLYVMMLILNLAICYLLYKICLLISNKNVNLSLFIMIITDLLLALGFVTTRAQMVSYVILLVLIYVLELYVKTDKTKYLWWVPVLSILQINLHASLWWMLILIVWVYIIDAIRKPKIHLQGYRMKPLIITMVASFLVGFINPYGWKMITYIFTSYGAPEISGMVDEMRPFYILRSTFTALLYLALVTILVLYIFGDSKKVRVRYLLMLFGFLALGLNSSKGLSQFVLTMFFPLALVYKNVRIERILEARIARDALLLWIGLVAISVFATQCATVIPRVKDGPADGIIGAMDSIEEKSGGNKDVRVYVGYNNGGYVEYRGYKAYLDPRAEVFLEKNNGKENILKEWEDMTDGKIDLNEFLEKYNFDYLIADEPHEENIYNMKNKKYELIYENDEEKIRVFKKV